MSWSEQRRRNIEKTRELQQELFGTHDFASYTARKLAPSKEEQEEESADVGYNNNHAKRRPRQGQQRRRRATDVKVDGSRKSARLQGKEVSLKDENLDLEEALKGYPGRTNTETGSSPKRKRRETNVPHTPPADSSKNLKADVDNLNENWLGQFINMELGGPGKQAKRAVMNLASASGKKPRFNKMSGIQEFTNAILLFVNIDMTTRYNNVFQEDGKYMTWFAQPTQNEETPVIQRLINSKNSTAEISKTQSPADRICLFIRLPERPYLYLGELKCVSHEPQTRPLMFVWELVHFKDVHEQEHLVDVFKNG